MTVNKVEAVSKRYFNPVDAIKLYTDVSNRATSTVGGENPFANTI